MLVTPDWCRMMARYNSWQNDDLRAMVAVLPAEAMTLDRSAFFGSILRTLSHLLWADRVWLARMEGRAHGLGGIAESVTLAPDARAWAEGRREADAALAAWAEAVTAEALVGDLTWTPASGGAARTEALGLVASHVFNHQTHHRGQVHAMLTAAGARPGASDLIAMPT